LKGKYESQLNHYGGEKRMNKKILVIPVLLLTFALLTIPVMGAPATKIEGVTATLDITKTSVYTVVDHGILQIRDGIATGTVTINIPGQDPLVGTVYGEFIGTMKLNSPSPPWPGAESVMMGCPVFTFTGEGTTGTFEGVRHTKMIGFPEPVVSYINTRFVLHGTGDFLGQTLKLSYEGAPPISFAPFEGTLLIPN
jgi:hypothetical protein